MTASKQLAATPDERFVVITRTFDVPRELVWMAWTDPKHVAAWWGPRGFTNPVCEWSANPGGKILVHMRGPDGTVYPMSGAFREVVPLERLVFVAVAEDHEGNPLLEALTTVTFEQQGPRTRLTVRAKGVGIAPIAAQMLAGMEQGWSESIDKLGELLARSRS